MPRRTLQLSFFVILTGGLFILSIFVFRPYLGVIFLAAILAISFHPVYEALLAKSDGNKKLASLCTVGIVIVVTIIPAIVLSTFVLKEAVSLYNSIAFSGGADKVATLFANISNGLNSLLPAGSMPLFEADQYIRSGLEWVIGHFDSVFNAVFKGVLGFVLLLLSLFYLFINGKTIKKFLVAWSPLPDEYDREVLDALRSSVDGVLRGRFLIAIAQGFFLGLGFVIFGVPLPVLWGFVAAISSLVPILGTALVTVPAAALLFLSGNVGAAIGVLIWGALAVGLIDDTLTFFILKRKVKMHPLIILFSVLGGVALFGPLGFVAGPVVVSTLVAMVKIYPSIFAYRSSIEYPLK